VYRLMDDDPDEAGLWMNQLEAWVGEVRRRLREARHACLAAVACEAARD
jgi:hypothetical protein